MQVIDYEGGGFSRPCVLLLGYFDGVHVGHRALIAAAKRLAEEQGAAVGVTTFYDAKNGGQIYDFNERCRIFSALGIDFVYAAHFDGAFRATEGEAFLSRVCAALSVRAFVCGADYTFGRGAACGVSALQAFAESRGIAVRVLPLVAYDGEKAAATRAKRCLAAGDMPALAGLLGGRYFIAATVVSEGRHIGRTMGFPTANMHVPPCKYPLREGVYAVSATIGKTLYRGIANYGARPTFKDARVVLEVYFDGFSGDLYGRELVVYFDAFLRPVQKFPSAGALAEQLQQDLRSIR